MADGICFIRYSSPLVWAIILKDFDKCSLCPTLSHLDIPLLWLKQPGINANAAGNVIMNWDEYEQRKMAIRVNSLIISSLKRHLFV
jgi:hypothetical protein